MSSPDALQALFLRIDEAMAQGESEIRGRLENMDHLELRVILAILPILAQRYPRHVWRYRRRRTQVPSAISWCVREHHYNDPEALLETSARPRVFSESLQLLPNTDL